jgi:hypothetical protein
MSACPISPREARADSLSTSSEDLVRLLRSGLAPREIRLRAARGQLPLDPGDSLRALLTVLNAGDPEAADTARETLRAVLPDHLASFVKSGGAAGDELDLLARETDDPFVLEEIVRSRSALDETLLFLAQTVTGRPQEALIANQARLLAEPALIRGLLENPELTAEGRRLISELTEEFFEKRARRHEAEARRSEQAAASAGEASGATQSLEADEDVDADAELGELEEDSESPGEPAPDDDPAANSLFIGAIYRRIATMTISEKIKLAYTGSKEERRILIGDSNKLIGLAVLKSRALSVNEVETFAGMRNVDEDIFRRILLNRDWMRKPAVVIALVRNPRVPLDITLPLLKRLPIRELRAVFRDRNLPVALRSTARRFLVLKRR